MSEFDRDAARVWSALDDDGTFDDIKSAIDSGVDLSEKLPEGKYEVKLTKLEPGISKNNNPMIVCWMQVVAGQHKDKHLFYYLVISKSFQMKNALDFLNSLIENYTIELTTMSDLYEEVNKLFQYSKDKTYHINLTYKKEFPNVEILGIFKS